MVAQLNYTKNIPSRLAGLIYDIGNTNIDSFAAEGVVNHGRFVGRGTDAQGQCIQNGNAAAIGVAIRHASENDYQQAAIVAGSYKDEETVAILREGYIWAEFDAAGGTLDGAVTINASGQVVAAGTGTALTSLAAYIEKPAVDAVLEGQAASIFVGLIRVSAK